MTEVLSLIAKCRDLGVTLAPGPEGNLRVAPPGRLPEDLREELKRHKAAVLTLLAHRQEAPWPCPACDGQVQLEPADDNAPSRFWTCSGCGTWGATRKGAAYPTVWVGRRTVH